MANQTSVQETLQIRAAVNKWISDGFPELRRYLSHAQPKLGHDGTWRVTLLYKSNERFISLGELVVDENCNVALTHGMAETIVSRLQEELAPRPPDAVTGIDLEGNYHRFCHGDGISGAAKLDNRSVDLLLTDPPYSISNPYICEGQVPRRLRKDGRDFIMPKGHFGEWDYEFSPEEWTTVVLPKVKGWAVIFCAQEQIGEYSQILRSHKFVAVGTLVWQKTNPVPFNHTHKPINAWEALVIGKRPGTKFNASLVHNVFVHKSPSPQERIHPTQKPVGLISQFIELFSNREDLVLDPFAGSATTVVAAVALHRRVLAYENDASLFQAACKRIIPNGEPLV